MSLVAISLMGQPTKKSIQDYKNLKNQNKIEVFKSQNERWRQHDRYTSHRFTSKQIVRFKSIQVLKQVLGSAVYEYYDEGTSQWIADNKDEYNYDANGNLTQYLEYELDESISQWFAENTYKV